MGWEPLAFDPFENDPEAEAKKQADEQTKAFMPPQPAPFDPFEAFKQNDVAERGSEFRSTPDKPAPGLLGNSFGMLSPEEQKGDLDARFADFNKQNANIQQLEKLVEQAKASGNPMAWSNAARKLEWAKQALPDIDQLQLMEAGERPLATKTALRSAVENTPRAFAQGMLAVPEFAGIVKGYVNGKVDDDSLLRWSQGAKAYVEQQFPGDAARQSDFSQQLASGLGSIATFYGAGAASALAKVGPKATLAVLAGMGSSQTGSAGFEEGSAELKRARDRAAAAGDTASVTEYDRFLKTLGYTAIGATAALPVAGNILGTSGRNLTQAALEQGAQMGGAQLAENAVTKATTDPNRGLGENVADAVGTGAILGGMFNAAHRLGRRAPVQEQGELDRGRVYPVGEQGAQLPPPEAGAPGGALPKPAPRPGGPGMPVAEPAPAAKGLLDDVPQMGGQAQVPATPGLGDSRAMGGQPQINAADPQRQALRPPVVDVEAQPVPPTMRSRGVRRETFTENGIGNIGVDAPLMQFKEGGDAQGVTERLKGVKEWDPVRAGNAIVYEFNDGRRIIADGHQRLGLAKRLAAEGKPVDFDAFVFREADGFTPQSVRAIAAMKNIAEGTGSSLDAAKVMRELGKGPDELDLPPHSALARDAAGLARLCDDAFGMVVNDIVPKPYAAIVGKEVDDPQLQTNILGLLARIKPSNALEARSIIAQAKDATVSSTQSNLFGDETTLESLYGERAKVLSEAAKQLKANKKVFEMLVRNEKQAEAAGNVLNRTENERQASASAVLGDIIERLAHARGPISDALTRSAREFRETGKLSRSASQFADLVTSAVERGDIDGLRVAGLRPEPARAQSEAQEVESPLFAIGAYHGSPHDFDEFKLDKIGTGEGAQAYGHGLYFAENPQVAKSYAGLHGAWQLEDKAGKTFDYGAEKGWLDALGQHGGDYDRAIQSLEKLRSDYGGMYAENAERGIAQLREWRKKGLTPKPLGKLYQTELDVEPHQLLDWDKLLSEQSPEVKKTLEGMYGNAFHDPRFQKWSVERLLDSMGEHLFTEQTGAPPMGAHTKYSAPLVSAKLHKAGIPGIRYLDQGSRTPGASGLTPAQMDARIKTLKDDIASGGGNQEKMRASLASLEQERDNWRKMTHNIVIFDDKLVKITHKDGKPVTPKERADVLQQMHKSQEIFALAPKGDDLNGGGRERAGNRSGRSASGSLAPLKGAPTVEGATGPDPNIVAAAEDYARNHGIDLRRQAVFAKVDEALATRIGAAYDVMPHDPTNPKVAEAYADMIRQTIDQYQALADHGFKFYFYDESNDPYQGNPWNAIRDLRENKRMAVFATEAGFGSGATDVYVGDGPMLAPSGLEWPYGSPTGPMKRVLVNDLFRAVHDAFGHSMEGAGFRARGEENAWQAHVRLYTGPAVGAVTTETRGQNSWLNYGPYGKANQTASVEDTVFGDQKAGLMPSWAWEEGRVGDEANDGDIVGSLKLGAQMLGGWQQAMSQHGDPAAAARAIETMIATDSRTSGDMQKALRAEGFGSVPTPLLDQGVLVAHALSAGRPKSEDMMFALDSRESITDTPAFKRWFDDSKAVGWEGEPLPVYHATLSDFDAFSRRAASPEGDMGAGFYFTDSNEDAANNYAHEGGPDIRSRIDQMIEQFSGDEDFYHEVEEANEGKTPDDPDWIDIHDRAREVAKEALGMAHEGMTIPVYLSIQNPFVLGNPVRYRGPGETTLDYNDGGVYDPETDDYEYGEPKGKLTEFFDAFRRVAGEYDMRDDVVDRVVSDLAMQAIDDGGEIAASDLVNYFKRSDHLSGVWDEEGRSAENEVLRSTLEEMGFDGIIDHTVFDKWGKNRLRFGGGMEGVNPDTTHYIVFKPNQIKSAIGNRGAFDPGDDRFTYAGGLLREDTKRHISAFMKMGRSVNIPEQLGKQVSEAIAPAMDVIPADHFVAQLVRIAPTETKGRVAATFKTDGGDEFEYEMGLDALFDARAFFARTETDNGSTLPGVFFVHLSPQAVPEERLRGELRHEAIHALRKAGRLDRVFDRLVSHANHLRVLDYSLGDYLEVIGMPVGNPEANQVRIGAAYADNYRNRTDFAEVMNQEAVAHMAELYSHGVLTPQEVRPVKHVLDAIFAGKFSKGNPEDIANYEPELIQQAIPADIIALLREETSDEARNRDLARVFGAADAAEGGQAGYGSGAEASSWQPEEDQIAPSREDFARSSRVGTAFNRRPIRDRLQRRSLDEYLGDYWKRRAALKRAKLQGFDVDAWHGTTAEYLIPKISAGDWGFHMAVNRPTAANQIVEWDDMDVMKQHVTGGSVLTYRQHFAHVMPLKVKMKNPFRWLDEGNWSSPLAWEKVATWHMRHGDPDQGIVRPPEGGQFQDVEFPPLAMSKEIYELCRKAMSDEDGYAATEEFHRALIDLFEEHGYDGVVYSNNMEDVGNDSIFVWNPAQVRSRFDAFDPRANGKPGLFASVPYLEADLRKELNEALKKEGLSGPLFAFAGRKALTADFSARTRAEDMERAGKSAIDILRETGWKRGLDQEWKFEIADGKARVDGPGLRQAAEARKNDPEQAYPIRLDEVLHHPKLYAAYPELRAIQVLPFSDPDANILGGFMAGQKPTGLWNRLRGQEPTDSTLRINVGHPETETLQQLRAVILHEVQHAIQTIENFAEGSNVQAEQLAFWSRLAIGKLTATDRAVIKAIGMEDELRTAIAKLAACKAKPKDLYLAEMADKAIAPLAYHTGIALYLRSAGEIEARLSQRRAGIPEDQLRHWPYEPEYPAEQIPVRRVLDGQPDAVVRGETKPRRFSILSRK